MMCPHLTLSTYIHPCILLFHSRKNFFAEIWKCCKNLFLMGPSERTDAYTILSLYVSYYSKSEVCGNDSISGDLRADKEFWDEMKNGLVYIHIYLFGYH